MADRRLSALTELDAAPAVDDEVYIRDVSEEAEAESKRITIANLMAAVALVSLVEPETRDITAASGDVSYTGYDFQPTALVVFAADDGTTHASWGMVGSNGVEHDIHFKDTSYQRGAQLIQINNEAGNTGQSAVLKTFDADGYTWTWTKLGTPGAGTIWVQVLALK